MSSEYYLTDPAHKRRLFLGSSLSTGLFWHEWLNRQTAPFSRDDAVAAFRAYGEQDARDRRYDYDPDVFERFAARIWAFCVTSEWKQEVRWASHDYEDEYLPAPSAWHMPKPDPEWKTVGSWYARGPLDPLDPDPLASEMAVVLAS